MYSKLAQAPSLARPFGSRLVVVSEWVSATGRDVGKRLTYNSRGRYTGTRAIVLLDPRDTTRAQDFFGKWKTLRSYKQGRLGLNSQS